MDVTYPTCGGTCPDGLACIPYDSALDGQLCICADGGASCGSACGGFVCPGGQVCTDDGSGCGCAP